jgi:hypothetical protein
MKLLESLTAPFLLRRLVRASERQAKAVEDIRDLFYALNGSSAGIRKEYDDSPDGDDILYASDQSSWNHEVEDLRRPNRAPEEEAGS